MLDLLGHGARLRQLDTGIVFVMIKTRVNSEDSRDRSHFQAWRKAGSVVVSSLALDMLWD